MYITEINFDMNIFDNSAMTNKMPRTKSKKLNICNNRKQNIFTGTKQKMLYLWGLKVYLNL